MLIEAIGARAVRSSLENPNTSLTGSQIFSILGSGAQSASGVSVTRDSSLAHPVLFRGIQLIANDVAKLPVYVYRRNTDGSRERDARHAASPLLRKRVNLFIKSHTFFKTLVGHALLHRGGYARIFRDGAGRPRAMDILDPEQTYPLVADGQLWYQTTLDGNPNSLLPGDRVFHIRGLGFDGLDGWSVIDKLKDAIGLGLAAQKFGAVYFANSAQPRVVIKFPGYLKDEMAVERFRNSWGAVHGGANNAHKPAILEGGAEIQPFQMTNEDSQFLELRQFDVRMIATILGVPPHKLGDDTRTSFASLEQENQSYLDEAIDPWLREIETEANEKLLTEREHMEDRAFVEFERKALIRTNLTDRFSAYNNAIMTGWMSRAEVRRAENMNDADGLDEYFVPLNMGIAGDEPEEQVVEEPAQEDSTRDQLRAVLEKDAKRMIMRVVRHADRAAKKPDKFLGWLDSDLESDHLDVWAEDISTTVDQSTARVIAQGFLQEIHRDLLELSGTVSAADLQQSVSQQVYSYLVDLPPRIASEVLAATNKG